MTSTEFSSARKGLREPADILEQAAVVCTKTMKTHYLIFLLMVILYFTLLLDSTSDMITFYLGQYGPSLRPEFDGSSVI